MLKLFPMRPVSVGDDVPPKHRWILSAALAALVAAPLVFLTTSSGCATGGRKAEIMQRRNRIAVELRELVPAVLAAKKKARPILSRRRLPQTGISLRGLNDASNASFGFSSIHAGVQLRGKITGDSNVGAAVNARIQVSKRRGKK